MHQLGIKPAQARGVAEQDVARPFALISRPVVLDRKGLEHRRMQRVQAARHAVQQVGPCRLHLPVHQPLRPLGVFQPGEAVVALQVAKADRVHLPRQPRPAVQADLDGERKPGLNAGTHEPELPVDAVVIEMQALAPPRLQLQALGSAIAHDLVGQAWLDRRENADQPLLDPIRGRDLAGDGFLVHRARRQIADRPASPARPRLRRFPELPAQLFGMLAKILQQDPRSPQIGLHPRALGQAPQRPAEHQSVEAAKRPGDSARMARYESLHGVPLLLVWPLAKPRLSSSRPERRTRVWLRPLGRAV
jgi:hypothetical protein